MEIVICECCGDTNAIEKLDALPYMYAGTLIYFIVPVITCSVCNLSYTDYRKENIIEKALSLSTVA